MARFTVILSEIDVPRIDTACWMPARKLAGAAMAAASNKRLMVMPADVTATTEPGPLSPAVDAAAALDRYETGGISIATSASGFASPAFLTEGRPTFSTEAKPTLSA